MNWGKAEILKAGINNKQMRKFKQNSPSVDGRAILIILYLMRENLFRVARPSG